MTIVKAAAFCPYCSTEMPGPVNTCPTCLKVLRAPESDYFGVPDYLSTQMKDYAREMEDRMASSKPLGPADIEKFEKIKKEYELWVREIPAADKIAAMVDAQHVLKHIIHSKIDPDQLEEIIGRGIAIGQLAEAMKRYFKCGGMLREPETRYVPTEPRDTGRSATATYGGRDPSGGDSR